MRYRFEMILGRNGKTRWPPWLKIDLTWGLWENDFSTIASPWFEIFQRFFIGSWTSSTSRRQESLKKKFHTVWPQPQPLRLHRSLWGNGGFLSPPFLCYALMDSNQTLHKAPSSLHLGIHISKNSKMATFSKMAATLHLHRSLWGNGGFLSPPFLCYALMDSNQTLHKAPSPLHLGIHITKNFKMVAIFKMAAELR